MDVPKIKNLSIQKLLNDAIFNTLYGGSTDPGWSELESAASMYAVLKISNLKVRDESDLLDILRKDNIHEKDFLEPYIK